MRLCLMLLHELRGILLLPPPVSFPLLLQCPLPLLRLLELRLSSGHRHCGWHLGLQLLELLRDPLGVVVP